MSFFEDLRRTPAATKPPGRAAEAGDIRVPLTNLAAVQSRMDSLQIFLSDSVNSNTLLAKPQIDMVSSEITSAIHQIILNGAALLSCSPSASPPETKEGNEIGSSNPTNSIVNPKAEIHLEDELDDYDIIELDAVELLAEHVHFCEVCGKGFKRDANLRMHMRAHGNQFKTPEALSKPEKAGDLSGVQRRRTRFSCPYVGCNRNKQHKKFRALKSTICVKNHFKRSHCPKMFSCNRCNKKSFSVVADLKSHLKHCGESKWKCCCGTSFSRKDKLFGHMALFEGHMPAVVVEEGDDKKGKGVAVDDDENEGLNLNLMNDEDGFGEGYLIGGLDYCFEDVLNSGFFNF